MNGVTIAGSTKECLLFDLNKQLLFIKIIYYVYVAACF